MIALAIGSSGEVLAEVLAGDEVLVRSCDITLSATQSSGQADRENFRWIERHGRQRRATFAFVLSIGLESCADQARLSTPLDDIPLDELKRALSMGRSLGARRRGGVARFWPMAPET